MHLFGSTPYGTFIETAGGDMYAMTFDGGTSNLGTILLSHYTGGSLSVIKQMNFTGLANGSSPVYGKFIEECWLPLNASPITPTSFTVCQGSTAGYSLTIDPIVNASSYTWTPPPGGVLLSGVATNTITMSFSVLPVGVYTVSVYGWNYCGDGVKSAITITVIPSPTVSIAASSLAMCTSGGTLTGSGASTYSWSTGETTSSIIVTPLVSTIYTLTGTSLGCSDTETVSITTLPSPTVVITPTNFTVCSGVPTTLTATGAATYSWSTGPTTSTISVSPLINTIYIVVGSTAGCPDTKTVSVTVKPSPTLTITLSAPSNTICKGSELDISADGANAYSWNTGASTASISVAPSINTTYTVTGTGTNGCTTVNLIDIIMRNPDANLTVTGNSIICEGSPLSITASGATTYSWSTGETSDNITPKPSITTSYIVWSPDPTGCVSTKTVNVTVKPVPTVSIGSDVEMNLGSTFQFNPTETSANSYKWSPSSGLDNPNIINPITSTLIDITYTLTVTSLNGCKASDDVFVKIGNKLIIPNYMSPNGDGINDTWNISVPRAIKDYKIQIFDSWSKLVFTIDSNYNNEWNAHDLPDGVYYYVITEGVNLKYKGSITVTR